MQEKKCKAFENLQELVQATGEHGVFVRSKNPLEAGITGLTLSGFATLVGEYGRFYCSLEQLLDNFVFSSDGSPCGKVEA